MLTVWIGLLALLTFSLQCIGQSTERPPRPAHNIDIHNGTALQEYTASLRRLLVQSGGGRSMPGMSRNSLAGRLRNPFEGVGLKSRQTCTCSTCTDNKSYCFPADAGSYCSNCGVCCVADKSYCCNFQTAVCCPGDTDGCCEEWQTCDMGVGCKDPSTTISTTITSWFTSYGTSTMYATNRLTTTVFTTEVEFVTRTVSNVDIATQVSYTTVTLSAEVRRKNINNDLFPTSPQAGCDAEERANVQATHSVSAAQAPVVTVYAHADFDLMAHKLEHIGVIVKRQTTITSYLTFTVTATTQINSVVTSTISSVSSIISTIHSNLTSTVFRNAATTVEVTSTMTAPPLPASTSSAPTPTSITLSTPTSSAAAGSGASSTTDEAAAASSTGSSPSSFNSGGSGLSSGASAGIGMGAAAGAALLGALLFFLWRRHRKSQQNKTAIHRSNSPTAGSAVGAGFSEKGNSPYATSSPPQRQSYLSNTNTMSTHSYQAVPPSEASMMTGATGRPAEMPDNRGFQYAPYELYDETGYEQDELHEMYTREEHGTR